LSVFETGHGSTCRTSATSDDLSGAYARRSSQESRSCRHLPRISPVVDHLADLALQEAELAADPAGVDPLSVASSLLDRLSRYPTGAGYGGFGIPCWSSWS